MSENCPACGEQKHRRADPFCPECLHRLPDPLIEQLSQKEHFIQAFGPAMDHLAKPSLPVRTAPNMRRAA